MPSFLKGVTMGMMGGYLDEKKSEALEAKENRKLDKLHEQKLVEIGKEQTLRNEGAYSRKELELQAAELKKASKYLDTPALKRLKLTNYGDGDTGKTPPERLFNQLEYLNGRAGTLENDPELTEAERAAFWDYTTRVVMQGSKKQVLKEDGSVHYDSLDPRLTNLWGGMRANDESLKDKGGNGYLNWWRKVSGPDKANERVFMARQADGSIRRLAQEKPPSEGEEVYPTSSSYRWNVDSMGMERLPMGLVESEYAAYTLRINPNAENSHALRMSLEKYGRKTINGDSIAPTPSDVIRVIAAGTIGETFTKNRQGPNTVATGTKDDPATPKEMENARASYANTSSMAATTNKLLNIIDNPKSLIGNVGKFNMAVNSVLGDLEQFSSDEQINGFKSALSERLAGGSSDDQFAALSGVYSLLNSYLVTSYAKFVEAGASGQAPRLTDQDYQRALDALKGPSFLGFVNPASTTAALRELRNLVSKSALDSQIVVDYGRDGRHTKVGRSFNAYWKYLEVGGVENSNGE